MNGEIRYSPTYIDNRPYAVTIPTVNQWETVMKVTEHRSDFKDFLHITGNFSWCQDDLPMSFKGRQVRGFDDPHSVHSFNSQGRTAIVGFRPLLIPLNPDTLQADHSILDRIPDGIAMDLGTLYINGTKITTMYPGKDFVKNTPDYSPNSLIQLGDSSLDIYSQIRFIKCDHFLIADRNILKNVSWEDLDRCGLVYGNGVDVSLFKPNPSLDDIISLALAESQKQLGEELKLQTVQTIKYNLKNHLNDYR